MLCQTRIAAGLVVRADKTMNVTHITQDDINKLIIKLRPLAPPTGTWEWVSNKVHDTLGVTISPNACRCRYDYRKGSLPVEPTYIQPTNLAVYDRNVKFHGRNVAIISDTHIPFCEPGYLNWFATLCQEYKVDTVIHIGDVLDNYAISSYLHSPDGMSAGDELAKTREQIKDWVRAFPNLKICLGNHDTRHLSAAVRAGLSTGCLRHMNDLLGTPKTWEWSWSYVQTNGLVYYEHGSGYSGQNAVFNAARAYGESVVIGHTHINPGVVWLSNPFKDWFGLNVGSAVDQNAYAFAYASAKTMRGTLGGGLVLDNGRLPVFIRYPGE